MLHEPMWTEATPPVFNSCEFCDIVSGNLRFKYVIKVLLGSPNLSYKSFVFWLRFFFVLINTVTDGT